MPEAPGGIHGGRPGRRGSRPRERERCDGVATGSARAVRSGTWRAPMPGLREFGSSTATCVPARRDRRARAPRGTFAGGRRSPEFRRRSCRGRRSTAHRRRRCRLDRARSPARGAAIRAARSSMGSAGADRRCCCGVRPERQWRRRRARCDAAHRTHRDATVRPVDRVQVAALQLERIGSAARAGVTPARRSDERLGTVGR